MENIQKIIDDAWLGIDVDESQLFNPMQFIYDNAGEDKSNFINGLTWLATRPEYLSFTCKYIFNVEISPMQALLISDMWNRKRPMLIGSRGLGKAQPLNAKILTEDGWREMGSLKIGDRVFGSNGKLCNVIDIFPQGMQRVYKITFMDGRSVECSGEHLWPVEDKYGNQETLSTLEIIERIKEKKVLQIKINNPIDHLPKKLPEDPYKFGQRLLNKLVSKKIPDIYKFSSIEDRLQLLRGYLDKKLRIEKDFNKSTYVIVKSKDLADGLVDIMRSLGIRCRLKISTKHAPKKPLNLFNKRYIEDIEYVILLRTKQKITTNQELLDLLELKHDEEKIKRNHYTYSGILQVEALPIQKEMQCIAVDSPDNTYITNDYIVTHNSFTLSLYAMLRALLLPSRKVIVVGAAFRQSKILFEYCENIWNNAPVLRDMCDSKSGASFSPDMGIFRLNTGKIVFLPLGNGEKIRGQRAHDIIADEFATIPLPVFETVIKGFSTVASDPIEKMKYRASKKKAAQLGVVSDKLNDDSEFSKTNQTIVSGTADYDFKHFAAYWRRYIEIISCKKDPKKKAELFKNEDIKDAFNEDDYTVYRIPVELLPEGLMDEGVIADAKATVHSGIYEMEFGSVFSSDSKGFFKRSLIESCVVSEENPIIIGGEKIFFDPVLRGNPHSNYIIGVDPASEVDNFSIVVLEVCEDHRKVVYCWTTTRERHKVAHKEGYTDIDDFYSYCARKIRDLMSKFNTIQIAMDPQGGGIAVMEALHARSNLQSREVPIWPIIDPEKPSDTDDEMGLHIVRLCNFSSAQWTSESNHGLRKDMEDKKVIFPFFDTLAISLSLEEDKKFNRISDTLEDCTMEIEELKKELSLIEIQVTTTGRERWDTPGTPSGKKNKLRKDRYSALLMANDAARRMSDEKIGIVYEDDYYKNVGFADRNNHIYTRPNDTAYHAPGWYQLPGDIYD